MDPGTLLRRAIAAAALTTLSACASSQLDMETLSSASDDVVYEAGVKAATKKDYESARQYYRRLVEAFPQTPHLADARIGLADSYFDEGGTGNYVLAVSSYREFLTLYPQHPRSDYAQFKAAESYFEQKNSPDRDQTATMQALEEYERLLDVYPQSQYVEKARERIRDCHRRSRARTSRSATSTSAPASPGARRSAATRRSSTTTRTSRGSTRCCSAWARCSRSRGATPRPGLTSPGSATSSPRARSSPRRTSSKRPSPLRSRLRPPPLRRVLRPIRPERPRLHLKWNFEELGERPLTKSLFS
jgi:outer membrane assembly lipoprotein YfiO